MRSPSSPLSASLHHLLSVHGEEIAVCWSSPGCEPVELTYHQLHATATAISRGLRQAGAHGGARVADLCDEGTELVLALVALAYAGAVLVPLDPAAPPLRIRAILDDAQPALAICSRESGALSELGIRVFTLLELKAMGEAGGQEPPPPYIGSCSSPTFAPGVGSQISADTSTEAEEPLRDRGTRSAAMGDLIESGALNHIIYTSGSTGAPKGVACPVSALHAYCRAKIAAQEISHDSRVLVASGIARVGSETPNFSVDCANLQGVRRHLLIGSTPYPFSFSAHTWDPCVGDVWSTLLAGGTVCVVPRHLLLTSLLDVVHHTRATHLCATPTLFALMMAAFTDGDGTKGAEHSQVGDAHRRSRGGRANIRFNAWRLSSLRVVALGGEQLAMALAQKWAAILSTVPSDYLDDDAQPGAGNATVPAEEMERDSPEPIGAQVQVQRPRSQNALPAKTAGVSLFNTYGVTEATVYQTLSARLPSSPVRRPSRSKSHAPGSDPRAHQASLEKTCISDSNLGDVTTYAGGCPAEITGISSSGWPLEGVILGLAPFVDGQSNKGNSVGLDDGGGADDKISAYQVVSGRGLIGEVLLSGVQVDGVHYWRRPDLTEASFVTLKDDQLLVVRRGTRIVGEHCSSSKDPDGGQKAMEEIPSPDSSKERRWFRTGDLATWSDETGLTLLGRMDAQERVAFELHDSCCPLRVLCTQVKLRGQRLELSEIEAIALTCCLVRAAAAAVRGDQLLLYTVPKISSDSFAHGGAMAVSLHMRARLPDAIVPSRVIAIDSLPLTPGGKLLRSALPDPPPLDAKVVGVGVGGRGLATQTERLVAAAWEAELSLPPESVGPSSNFFALGGTSTAAVRMLRRLAPDLAGGGDAFELGNQRFATRLCGVYRCPTVRGYSAWLEWASAAPPSAVGDDLLHLSSGQLEGTTPMERYNCTKFVTRHDSAVRRIVSIGGALPQHSRDVPHDDRSCDPGCIPHSASSAPNRRLSESPLLATNSRALPVASEASLAGAVALGIATEKNELDVMAALLNAGVPPNGVVSRNDLGGPAHCTPLFAASAAGHTEATALLLAADASANLSDLQNRAPLHAAAVAGSLPVVRMLLRAKAQVHARNANKWCALFHAAATGTHEVLADLIAWGLPKSSASNGAKSARHTRNEDRNDAVSGGNLGDSNGAYCLRTILDSNRRTRNAVVAVDRWGLTPLCWAARHGNAKAVELLLAARANPNGCGKRPSMARLERNTRLPSSEVRSRGGLQIKSWGASLANVADYSMESDGVACHKTVEPYPSASMNSIVTVESSCSSGFPPSLLDDGGWSPPISLAIHAVVTGCASAETSLKLICSLLDAHANPSLRDANGRPPNSVAKAAGLFDVVEALATALALEAESRAQQHWVGDSREIVRSRSEHPTKPLRTVLALEAASCSTRAEQGQGGRVAPALTVTSKRWPPGSEMPHDWIHGGGTPQVTTFCIGDSTAGRLLFQWCLD